jgi:signal transduction histidine kinase
VTKTESDQQSPHHAAPGRDGYRRAALAALAAELGHELQGPLNLFRLTQERLARGAQLDAEDLSLLGEELDRLSRLCGRLRELARSPLSLRSTSPRALLETALASTRRPLDVGLLELELDPSPPISVVCDAELLGRALRELIDNALEARCSRAGVRFQAGAQTGLCVWDDGPGLELEPALAMAWGVTTRQGAAGLGLTLALRAARAHGFSLELRRNVPLTEAWLWVPERALSSPGAGSRP